MKDSLSTKVQEIEKGNTKAKKAEAPKKVEGAEPSKKVEGAKSSKKVEDAKPSKKTNGLKYSLTMAFCIIAGIVVAGALFYLIKSVLGL